MKYSTSPVALVNISLHKTSCLIMAYDFLNTMKIEGVLQYKKSWKKEKKTGSPENNRSSEGIHERNLWLVVCDNGD
jgi:hypothetical protein